MLTENDNIVLEQALNAFNKETGLRLYIIEVDGAHKNKFRFDAVVGLKQYEPLQFAVEIKKWAQHVNFGALIDQVKRLAMKGLLVADYVNPKLAERLREEEVQFIDTAGNAYINAEPLYIYVKGKRNTQEVIDKKERKRRAFTQAGLKVIYALLCKPDLVRVAYRDIAEIAGVALGTVGWVMGDLKEMGYVKEHGGKRNRRLDRYFELLDKWVEMYPGILRPKQVIGVFNKEAITDMTQIDIQNYDAYWGGEVAGNEYTGYLKPEIATIYIPEHRKAELIRDFKLFKGGNKNYGVVKLYKPFWKKPEIDTAYVHPVLAYADLIATGDGRNIETARRILDEHIRTNK
jgi:hypothetical protein